ncbi:glutamine-hydrolyzing carbamoyl-phosphate synthase small subunit [Candidatus Woesearchaeota archaeon]|nr:glutamine-hydrolyzing carbamoyl-phosphate synthase small subunit [Candidatus Woesearchaeota archaeon]
MTSSTPAKLILEDGTILEGVSCGFHGSTSGEVVFNTGMVGYPESFTDPSYKGQILVLTYPLIGNYGMPSWEKSKENIERFYESSHGQIQGMVVAHLSLDYSHWNAKQSLSSWLVEQKIPAITGIDTRALTKRLREKGVMLGKIVVEQDVVLEDPNIRNLVADVSIPQPVTYENGKMRIVVVDTGCKNNILRSLLARNVTVIRVPWDYDFHALKFDGLFLSNGPGDPKQCTATIAHLRKAIDKKIPTFGICLGNQLLALASGADTYKLKYGHRGQNQPCIDTRTGRCYITSQNHGFAVDTKTLKSGWKELFVNANDQTNEGIMHESGLFMSCQFHPEATPGPTDTGFLFDQFIEMVKQHERKF